MRMTRQEFRVSLKKVMGIARVIFDKAGGVGIECGSTSYLHDERSY